MSRKFPRALSPVPLPDLRTRNAIDWVSDRYLHRTADRIEDLGGVKYLIVTGRENASGE